MMMKVIMMMMMMTLIAMSFLRIGERHETPGVPRLPVCRVPALQPRVKLRHPTTTSEAVPAKAHKAPKALKAPRGPQGLPRPRTMSLEGEQRADKEKGKVGIIKKVCQSMSSLTSLE